MLGRCRASISWLFIELPDLAAINSRGTCTPYMEQGQLPLLSTQQPLPSCTANPFWKHREVAKIVCVPGNKQRRSTAQIHFIWLKWTMSSKSPGMPAICSTLFKSPKHLKNFFKKCAVNRTFMPQTTKFLLSESTLKLMNLSCCELRKGSCPVPFS